MASRGPGWKLAALVMLTCALSEAQPNATALVERFKSQPAQNFELDVAKELVKLQDLSVLTQLRPFLADPDRHLRGRTAFVFASLGDRMGFDTIVAILRDYSPDRKLLLPSVFTGAIRKNSTPPPQSLAQQIRSDRYYAVYLLGELKDSRAIPVLIPLLSDPDVDYEIPRALGLIGGDEALDGILLVLHSADPNARATAIDSIQRMKAKRALPQLRTLIDDHERAVIGGQVIGDMARRAISELEQ